jgi:hypothetical protein
VNIKTSDKMTAFWGMAPWRVIALMMEAVQTFETLVYFYDNTRRRVPEECHLFLAAMGT